MKTAPLFSRHQSRWASSTGSKKGASKAVSGGTAVGIGVAMPGLTTSVTVAVDRIPVVSVMV